MTKRQEEAQHDTTAKEEGTAAGGSRRGGKESWAAQRGAKSQKCLSCRGKWKNGRASGVKRDAQNCVKKEEWRKKGPSERAREDERKSCQGASAGRRRKIPGLRAKKGQ